MRIRWHAIAMKALPRMASPWAEGIYSARVLRGGSWNYSTWDPALRESRAGSGPTTGATTAASALPGRLPLESLPLYLLGFPKGQRPFGGGFLQFIGKNSGCDRSSSLVVHVSSHRIRGAMIDAGLVTAGTFTTGEDIENDGGDVKLGWSRFRRILRGAGGRNA